MKRLLLLGFLLTGCASAAYRDRPSTEECPVYVVKNDGFADVTLYVNGIRVMFAGGLQTSTRASCNVLTPSPVRMSVHSVEGDHEVPVQGPLTVERGARVYVYIGAQPAYSYAMSARK